MKHLLCCLTLIATPAAAQSADPAIARRVAKVLATTPVIDGHNDLPWELRDKFGSKVETTDLSAHSETLSTHLMTDMARLHAGHVGAQFWSVWIPPTFTGAAGIQTTLEQIDIVHRLAAKYPGDLEMAYSAADIVRIEKSGRVASLIGIEGGSQIGNSLPALRQFFALGARYMTLTHFKNNDWADSANDDPVHHGLTDFGKTVVREMNRIGMMVDLSHVSAETMKAALAVTRAPVIFSHSTARALNDNPRNVPDDVLALIPANGGIVMVDFYPGHLSKDYFAWLAATEAEAARIKTLYAGQPDRIAAAIKAWADAHPAPVVTSAAVADHIEHVARIAGHDHVAIGGDLDGVPTSVADMPGVDGYPRVFEELARRGWSDADLARLAGGNLLRVLRANEAVAASLKSELPSLATLP